MIVDGRSIYPSQAKEVNAALDAAFNNVHAIYTESPEVFLELADGQDCVELMVGGTVVHVHDRKGATPVYLQEFGDPLDANTKRITDIACGEIYRAAAELSPLMRIQDNAEKTLVVQALQLAACESERHGHQEQAEQFRCLWQEYENESH